MATAKDIRVAPVSSHDANALVKRVHYSGKVVNNSQLHLGVFLDGRLEGVMQFGPSLDKRKMLGLVEGTGWNEFLELNRMAFSERLPRNSESRALGVAFRLIRKHYPHIKWVVSFADGTQCGDGTIYRASGFVLTMIKESENLARLPNGDVIHKMTIASDTDRPRPELGGRTAAEVLNGSQSFTKYCAAAGATVLKGFQLRYIYFLDPAYRQRLTMPIIPFDKIREVGATMYRGQRPSGGSSDGAAPDPTGEGGSNPTPPLQSPAPSDPEGGALA